MDFNRVAGRSTPAFRLPQTDLPYQKVYVCMYVCQCHMLLDCGQFSKILNEKAFYKPVTFLEDLINLLLIKMLQTLLYRYISIECT